MKTYLESVKKENSLQVLKELCHNSNLSKTEISRRCGIGISTVAKITSGFAKKGIISPLYTNAENSARRIKSYGIKSTFHVTAYDISTSIFKAYLFRPGRKLKFTASYGYKSSLYFEDNFYTFCREVKDSERSITTRRLSGSLILLPGEPDEGISNIRDPLFPDTNILSPAEIVASLTEADDLICADKRQLHAAYIRENILRDHKLTLAVFLDKTRFSSCILLHGSDSTVISDIGNKFTLDGYPLIDYVKDNPEADHFIGSVVSVLDKLHSALGFTHLYICGDYVKNMGMLADMIHQELIKTLPTVSLIPCISDEEIVSYYCEELLYRHLSNIIFPNLLTI